jgi:hypothetical protein
MVRLACCEVQVVRHSLAAVSGAELTVLVLVMTALVKLQGQPVQARSERCLHCVGARCG